MTMLSVKMYTIILIRTVKVLTKDNQEASKRRQHILKFYFL